MKLNAEDFQNEKCPMTTDNCDKYQIKESYVKTFCDKGCSISCGEDLERHIKSKKEVRVV